MKKIIFITLLFLGTKSFAQGNLQFNQVISNTGSVNLQQTCSDILVLYTVPQQKVLKIEYFKIDFTTCQDHWLSINNTRISSGAYPLWLKAGDVIRVERTQGSCSGCGLSSFYLKGSHYLSAIEFNIIP